jgi:hypothetical protein
MSVATRSLAEACAEVARGGEKRHMTGERTTSRSALGVTTRVPERILTRTLTELCATRVS